MKIHVAMPLLIYREDITEAPRSKDRKTVQEKIEKSTKQKQSCYRLLANQKGDGTGCREWKCPPLAYGSEKKKSVIGPCQNMNTFENQGAFGLLI